MLPSAGMLRALSQVRGLISALPDPCAWKGSTVPSLHCGGARMRLKGLK